MSEEQRALKFGIIGCGALGLVHAQRLSALPGIEITALSDPDSEMVERIAETVAPGAARFGDYRQMLDGAQMDAVVINSPNRWHVEQLLASLENGLHVLCEKPLTMVPAEVSLVAEATKTAGKLVAIAYQSRYRRDSRLLRAALRSGKWGGITSINVFACENWVTGNIGTWRHDPLRCPGGYFADANGHQLDLLFWLTGLEAQWVRATCETRGTAVPIVTWGEARLCEQGALAHSVANGVSDSGTPFTFSFVGDAKQWREEISIQTEGADFVMRDTRLLWSDGSRPLEPFPEALLDLPEPIGDDTPDTAFVTALRGGAPPASPPHTVWPVLRFTLAALASAERRAPVLCE